MLADRFDGFLIDLDGVMYVGSQAVPGARSTIARLREREIPYRFLTNTSSATRDELVARLEHIGIDADRDEIVSAAWATGRYLSDRDIDTVAMVGNASLRTELRAAGMTLATENADAVVVGHDSSLSYADLTRGIRLLHDTDRQLIGVNGDPTVPREDGVVPGVGSILAALETGGGVTAQIVGKPEPLLFEIATETLDSANIAMIGDMLGVDIAGANSAGLGSILVAENEGRTRGEIEPDHRIHSISDLFDEGE